MTQSTLFNLEEERNGLRPKSADRRRDPMFLRNQFPGVGKWGLPFVRKQAVDLENVDLIAFTNTLENDDENFDLGVHFYVDDYRFEDIYAHPEKTLTRLRQYAFCCSPDFSVYAEMPLWRQMESVAKSRWVAAWWQSKGLTVVPTVTWDSWPSFEFCFDGIEEKSVVSVATYACKQDRAGFLRGYAAMLERITPEAVLCYGDPLPGMSGPLVFIPPRNPREMHRELRR